MRLLNKNPLANLKLAAPRWSAALRATRVVLGAILLTTCSTDTALAPGGRIQSAFDASALFQVGGEFSIPIDRVVLELRRVSDNTVAFSDTLTGSQYTQSGGQLIIQISLELTASPEDFTFLAKVFGGGVEYYEATGTVRATAHQTTTTTPVTPVYTGPGVGADLLTFPQQTTLINGQTTTFAAVVSQGGTPISGVPVAFQSSDSTLIRPVAVGLGQAAVTAPATGTGSVTITAKTPAGLTATGTLSWGPVHVAFVTVLPATPTIQVAQTVPLTATPYDSNDNVITGLPVTWASSADSIATVSTLGLVTGVKPGTATITATIGGVNGSTMVTVTAINPGVPASITPASTALQNVVVNQLATAPSVLVRDANALPVPGATVTFAVTAGGGSVTGASQVTNAQGIATVASWRVGQIVGTNTMTATVGTLTPAVFAATGTPTTIGSLVRVSGDSQSANQGVALPQPLVVAVRDSFNNLRSGDQVTWSVTDGSVTPTSGTTDVLGRTQTTWTLGNTQVNPTATASSGGAQTIFTATTIFSTPTIQLSFPGIPGVGVGLGARVRIVLTTPAPAGGTTVSLVSGNPSFFTVAPATVVIPQGRTIDSATVTGVSPGSALLTGLATGYTSGTLTVDVQNRNISVPGTLNVPYGQTASLPITLPAPAPAGGVTFSVTSNTPSLVAVLTPSVTIAAGSFTGNATLSGVLPGPALISVSNAAYVTATSNATATAALNITVGSAALNASFGTSIIINFESNGSATAAPAPGIPVTLVARAPACVAAQSPVTIATGQVNATSALTYGGSAPSLPCSTYVVATATNLQTDSVQVTVAPAPNITVSANSAQIGQGLMEAGSVSLAATNHGGTTVTVTSSDTTRFVLSTAPNTVGTPTLSVPVLPLVGSFTIYVMAKEGVTGASILTATAPGFTSVPDTVTEVVPAVEIQSLVTTTTTLSAPSNFYAQVGLPNVNNTALARVENVRPGGPPVLATFATQGGTSVGVIVDTLTTPTGAQSGQAIVRPTLYYTQTGGPTAGGVAFRPVGQGSDSVSVSIPGFTHMANGTRGISVTQPIINISANSAQVGVGLQDAGSVSLSASQHGGADVTITSADPLTLLLDTLPTGLGHPSVTKHLINGASSFTYYYQAVESSQFLPVKITATEPRFVQDTITVTLAQPGVELQALPTTTTTLTGNANVYAQVGLPNGQGTGLARVQNVRGGAPGPLTIAFASRPSGVGTMVDTLSQPAGADTARAQVVQGLYYTPTSGPNSRGVQFRPLAAGTDTVTVSAVGYLTTTINGVRQVAVTQPTASITINSASIGSGLQEAGGAFLSASQHGGATITLTSTNPAAILIDTLVNGPGHTSITKTLLNGQTSFTYYAQALEAQTGSAYVRITEPRFVSDSILIQAVQGGVEIQGLVTTTTALTPDNNFYVQIGLMNGQGTALARVQNRRGGASGVLTATLTSSTAAIATIVDSLSGPGGNATGTARIPLGLYYSSPNGPALGGVAFHPLLLGTTTVSASIPGFTTASVNGSRQVSVLQPGITLSVSSADVGNGLQQSGSGSLGASNHGGVQVTLTSSDSNLVKLSPNVSTAGTGSITISLANGVSGFSYYVQGMESGVGTVTITAVASGFTNGTTSVGVRQAAIEIQGLSTSQAAGGADQVFYAQIGIPNSQNSGLALVQNVRAGAPAPFTITFTSSNPAAGQITDLAGPPATTKTAQIVSGLYYTQTSLAGGGVAFHPLTAGQTTVSATNPVLITTSTNGNRTVTVQ